MILYWKQEPSAGFLSYRHAPYLLSMIFDYDGGRTTAYRAEYTYIPERNRVPSAEAPPATGVFLGGLPGRNAAGRTMDVAINIIEQLTFVIKHLPGKVDGWGDG